MIILRTYPITVGSLLLIVVAVNQVFGILCDLGESFVVELGDVFLLKLVVLHAQHRDLLNDEGYR